MKTRMAIVSLTGLLGWAALAGPAAAAPPGQGLFTLTADCGGGSVTVTTGGGASFWLDDQHYLLTSIRATAPGGTTLFEKSYGNRTGKGNAINCIATEDGVTFVVTAVAVP